MFSQWSFSLSSPSEAPIVSVLLCLMLSQRSLKLASLKKIFYFLFGVGNFYSSSSLLIYLTVSSNRLLIFSSVFFIQFCLFLYVFWIFVILLIMFTEHLYDHYLEFFIYPDCLSPFHLVLLGIYLIPSFRTYSSVASFHLISCFYLYVFGKLVMFSDLGEVALGRRLATCPSNILPCGHQGYML